MPGGRSQHLAIGFKFNNQNSVYDLTISAAGNWAEFDGAISNSPNSITFQRTVSKPLWARARSDGIPERSFLRFSSSNAMLDYMGIIDLNPAPGNDNCFPLPRFNAAPEYGYDHLGQDLRGAVGQPFGRTLRQLKTMAVNFTRTDAEIIDNYYQKVGLAEPHWVAPYPEAVVKFPPFWATLSAPPVFRKRVENGWHWNVSLRWREAY